MGRPGSLVVVGTGYEPTGHLTLAARSAMLSANQVLYLVANPLTSRWIKENVARAEDLSTTYQDGKPRMDSYEEMVERIALAVRAGSNVCAAFYGHPGVFVYPSFEVIRQLRQEGYLARMLPGISAEDCLYADLGLDPSTTGCQSYEATDFLVRPRRWDEHTMLIVWQVGVIGRVDFQSKGYDETALALLEQRLSTRYPPDHRLWIYEASAFPACRHRSDPIPLGELSTARVNASSTLVVPPLSPAALEPSVIASLGMRRDALPRRSRALEPELSS